MPIENLHIAHISAAVARRCASIAADMDRFSEDDQAWADDAYRSLVAAGVQPELVQQIDAILEARRTVTPREASPDVAGDASAARREGSSEYVSLRGGYRLPTREEYVAAGYSADNYDAFIARETTVSPGVDDASAGAAEDDDPDPDKQDGGGPH